MPLSGENAPYIYYYTADYRGTYIAAYSFNRPYYCQPYFSDSGYEEWLEILETAGTPEELWEKFFSQNIFVEPERYQIISAGRDGKYTGNINVDHLAPRFYPSGRFYTKSDIDNITSFSNGTLESAIP